MLQLLLLSIHLSAFAERCGWFPFLVHHLRRQPLPAVYPTNHKALSAQPWWILSLILLNVLGHSVPSPSDPAACHSKSSSLRAPNHNHRFRSLNAFNSSYASCPISFQSRSISSSEPPCTALAFQAIEHHYPTQHASYIPHFDASAIAWQQFFHCVAYSYMDPLR